MPISHPRAARLVRDVLALEPLFASEAEALAVFLDRDDAAAEPMGQGLLAARRRATATGWAEGLRRWNSGAARRLALMQERQNDRRRLSALMDLFTADFGDRVLQGDLDASGAIFPGHLVLTGATLRGSLRLDEAELTGGLHATGLVANEVLGEHARFAGPVWLDEVRVARSVRFSFSDFADEVDLDGLRVGRELWLRHAVFQKHVRMRAADIHRDASLGCSYAGPVDLGRTRFRDTVSFEGAVFAQTLDLEACAFEGRVFLNGLSIPGAASMRETRFGGDVRPSLDPLRGRVGPNEMLDRLRTAFGGQPREGDLA